MLLSKVFVCFSDAPLDIRIKSNLVADLLSLTGTENPFMFCSPISVLHCQKAHKCSTVERTAMLVWWTPVHFFSLCNLHVQVLLSKILTQGRSKGRKKPLDCNQEP